MKISEKERLLKKTGCQVKRHGKEHDVWRNPKTGGESQLPRHPSQELPAGTANRILKNLGLK